MHLPRRYTIALATLACAIGLACQPASAQDFGFGGNFDPNHTPVTAKLRCWYQAPRPDSAVATDFVEAELPLEGGWGNLAAGPATDLFYTRQSPTELREACEDAVSRIRMAGAVVDWHATAGKNSLNHPIWHTGDLAPGEPVERIVAFGDSLSDTGHLFNVLNWTFPNRDSWFLGRFSNGPVWTEYLAKRTGKTLFNWSVGGAHTKTMHGIIRGLGPQIESFRRYVALDTGYDPSRTLFTVMIGANDFMNDTNENWKLAAEGILGETEKALMDLARLGARKILVAKLPDISRTPAYQERPGDRELLWKKVAWFNEYLARSARNVSVATGAQLRIVDVEGKFDEMLDDPAAFGMRDTTGNCLGIRHSSPENYLAHHGARRCDPSTTVFWDMVHPTTRVHELMSGWALDATDRSWGLKN